MSQVPREAPREELVPIIKTNSVDTERLIQRLSEVMKEMRTSGKINDENISLVIELSDIYTELISKTTSDIIISPYVSEQVVLTDALLLFMNTEESILKQIIEEYFMRLEAGDRESLEKLRNYLYLDKLCYTSIIQTLKKRITHIYANMPPPLRPSLVSAFLGYEKIE